jgi:hypothetical protein
MSNRSTDFLRACAWAVAALGFLAGPAAAEEIRLPQGSPDAGREAFVELRCIQCHSVQGVDLKHAELGSRINLQLASAERFVRTYADLFTAISNPRHVVRQQYGALLRGPEGSEAEPFMQDLTRTMTVRQLIDLVAFLDERYAASVPGYSTRP